jgi:thioredoxin-related protein
MARTLVVGLVLGMTACQTKETDPVGRYDPSADASAEFAAAQTAAQASNRRILMEVGGNWCAWTRRLDHLLESHNEIARTLADGYVHVRINFSDENHNETFLSRFPKIGGYPHLFVLDASGTVLLSQDTTPLEVGRQHDPEKVLALLKKWAP